MSKQISTSFLDIGKIPPQAIELEEAVLGALILNGNSIYEISDFITPDAFYKDESQKVCQSIVNLFDLNKKIDMLTVTEELRRLKQLDEIGGPLFVSQLTGRVSSSAHIQEHYKIVHQKYIQREIIRISNNLSSQAFDDSIDVEDLVDFANREMDSVNEKKAGNRSSIHISQSLNESEESLRAREKAVKEGKMRGIPTPWIDLNKILLGWQPGLIVIGSRPSIGKTAIALALSKESAKHNYPAQIFSLETSSVRLTDRIILSEADMDVGNFRSGYMSQRDWAEFNKAKERLRKLPIYIDDNPNVNFNYVKARARVMQKKGLCSMIIIDYLQLADVEENRFLNRDRSLGQFTRKCKILSRQLNIPVILLVQLNRDVEARTNKKPEISDIRETGSAEGDADVIMLLHRPEHYEIFEDKKGNSLRGKIFLLVHKQKEGPTGDVTLAVNNTISKFSNYAEPSQQPSGKDKQLPPERDDINDIPDELPF